MKALVLIMVCAMLVGCNSPKRDSTASERLAVRRQLESLGKEERSIAGFERRLEDLGGTIKLGDTPDQRIATIDVIERRPGYFPPSVKTIRVVYSTLGRTRPIIVDVAINP
jgi:hypothetical protein